MDGIQRLEQLFKETFLGPAWHGDSVMEVLNKIQPDQWLNKVKSGNSIAELVHHMMAWRVFTLKKMEGQADYKMSDDFNFREITSLDQAGWDQLIEELKQTQEMILGKLKGFTPSKLDEQVPGHTYSFYVLLQGIIQHDLYHLGQIVLLKK